MPILAARAHAQAADTTNFRAGQWGAEFSLGNGLSSTTQVGVLRFHSARRALVLNVSGQLSRESGDRPGAQNRSSGHVSLGTRWYRPLTSTVLQSLTVGVRATRGQTVANDIVLPNGASAKNRTTSTGGGVFAELGGNWMVTSQFGLGAAWIADAWYSRHSRHVDGAPPDYVPSLSKQWNASIGGLVLRAGLYF